MQIIIKADDTKNALSNFHRTKIPYGGLIFPTAEHAFQAQRTDDQNERIRIRMAQSAGDARKIGESFKQRIGWVDMRVSIMHELLTIKFSDRRLAKILVDTGDAELIYANEWNDQFWGVYGYRGENWLGRVLMTIRDELRVKITNGFIITEEEGKIPAPTQKEIEEAAKSQEETEKAHYIKSFAMHVLLLQHRQSVLIDIRDKCKGAGSAIERRMIERRISSINNQISRAGRVWVALMTGRLKPWVKEEPKEKSDK